MSLNVQLWHSTDRINVRMRTYVALLRTLPLREYCLCHRIYSLRTIENQTKGYSTYNSDPGVYNNCAYSIVTHTVRNTLMEKMLLLQISNMLI